MAAWPQGRGRDIDHAVPGRISRSRALAVITLIYTAGVCLAGWLDLQQANGRAAPYPFADPPALLPAAVLLLAGLGTMTGAGLRALRSPNRIRPNSL
jgi:hypothetical protein